MRYVRRVFSVTNLSQFQCVTYLSLKSLSLFVLDITDCFLIEHGLLYWASVPNLSAASLSNSEYPLKSTDNYMNSLEASSKIPLLRVEAIGFRSE